MLNIKVSVLTPIYNHKIEYVRKCLESLQAQTMEDIEFILIDNGATKEAKELIKEFLEKDTRFRVLRIEKNEGWGKAINLGLDNAKGEYIGLVESDDWVESDMFTELYDIAIKNRVNLVKSLYFEESQNQEKLINIFKDSQLNKIIKKNNVKNFLLSHASPWSILYKKDFLDNYNIRIPKGSGNVAKDIGLVIKSFLAADTIFITNKAFYHYNVNNSNASMKIRKLTYITKMLFNVYDNIYDWFEKMVAKNMLASDLRAFIDKRLFFNIQCYIKDYNIIKIKQRKLFYKLKKYIKNTSYFTLEEKKLLESISGNPIHHFKELFCIKNDKDDKHKIITVCGIKFKFKFKRKNEIIAKADVANIVANVLSEEILRYLSVQNLHNETFKNFKFKHYKENIVIIGCGPSVKYYNNEVSGINIALNRSIFLDNIDFKYMFTWDYKGLLQKTPTFFEDVKKYKNCIKFYGKFLNPKCSSIPEFPDDEINNIKHFYSCKRYGLRANYNNVSIHPDIENYPMADFLSVSFPAIQFALYTHPRKLYLVGLDTVQAPNCAGIDNFYYLEDMKNGYLEFKKFAELHYPDIEIVSINPVGLKGLFKDVYTKNYIDEHWELHGEDIEIIGTNCEVENV